MPGHRTSVRLRPARNSSATSRAKPMVVVPNCRCGIAADARPPASVASASVLCARPARRPLLPCQMASSCPSKSTLPQAVGAMHRVPWAQPRQLLPCAG